MKRLKNNLINIGIYGTLVMVLLIPFHESLTFGKAVSITLAIAFTWGMLNEIITQLRKINGEKFENLEEK